MKSLKFIAISLLFVACTDQLQKESNYTLVSDTAEFTAIRLGSASVDSTIILGDSVFNVTESGLISLPFEVLYHPEIGYVLRRGKSYMCRYIGLYLFPRMESTCRNGALFYFTEIEKPIEAHSRATANEIVQDYWNFICADTETANAEAEIRKHDSIQQLKNKVKFSDLKPAINP